MVWSSCAKVYNFCYKNRGGVCHFLLQVGFFFEKNVVLRSVDKIFLFTKKYYICEHDKTS